MQASVPEDDVGLAMGMFVFARQTGDVVGVAVGFTVFSNVFASQIKILYPLAPSLLSLENASEAIDFIPKLRDLVVDPVLKTGILRLYAESIRWIWVSMIVLSWLGLLMSLCVKELTLEKEGVTRQAYDEGQGGRWECVCAVVMRDWIRGERWWSWLCLCDGVWKFGVGVKGCRHLRAKINRIFRRWTFSKSLLPGAPTTIYRSYLLSPSLIPTTPFPAPSPRPHQNSHSQPTATAPIRPTISPFPISQALLQPWVYQVKTTEVLLWGFVWCHGDLVEGVGGWRWRWGWGGCGREGGGKREVRSLGVWETRCVDKRDVRYWSLWGEGVDEGISGVT